MAHNNVTINTNAFNGFIRLVWQRICNNVPANPITSILVKYLIDVLNAAKCIQKNMVKAKNI